MITGEPPQFPIPACKETQIIALKGFADLKVLRYFCTELYLFIKVFDLCFLVGHAVGGRLVGSVGGSSDVTWPVYISFPYRK